MELLLGKHELAYVNITIKVCSTEYLTTQIQLVGLVLPTFKSWTVHKIIECLALGLLSSL